MNILDLLNDSEKKLLIHYSLDKGYIFFREGENPHQVFFIEKGKVKISSTSLNGEEEIINIFSANDIFANALIFTNNTLNGDIYILEKSEIYALNEDSLLSIFQQNLDFLKMYLSLLSQKTIKLTLRNKLLSKRSMEERILFYLEINNGKIKKNITLMSHLLLYPRESLSRMIHQLINRNLIKEINGYLILKK